METEEHFFFLVEKIDILENIFAINQNDSKKERNLDLYFARFQ